MTSNKGGDEANGFPHGFNVVDFPKVDSVSSNDMETEENAEAEHGIQVVSVAQAFELDLLGLKWKFDAVVKHVEGVPFVFSGLLPYDMDGNPVLLTIQQPEEESSESEPGPSHQVGHQGEPIETVQDRNVEISDEIIIPDIIVNDAEVTSDGATIVKGGNPISDIENGNNAHNTEDENVSAPPTLVISDGTEDIEIGSIDESVEKDEPPHSSDFPQSPLLQISPIIEESEGSRRTYICQFCGSAFQQLHQWKRHVSVHTGRAVMKCMCPRCVMPYRDWRIARRRHNAAYPH